MHGRRHQQRAVSLPGVHASPFLIIQVAVRSSTEIAFQEAAWLVLLPSIRIIMQLYALTYFEVCDLG